MIRFLTLLIIARFSDDFDPTVDIAPKYNLYPDEKIEDTQPLENEYENHKESEDIIVNENFKEINPDKKMGSNVDEPIIAPEVSINDVKLKPMEESGLNINDNLSDKVLHHSAINAEDKEKNIELDKTNEDDNNKLDDDSKENVDTSISLHLEKKLDYNQDKTRSLPFDVGNENDKILFLNSIHNPDEKPEIENINDKISILNKNDESEERLVVEDNIPNISSFNKINKPEENPKIENRNDKISVLNKNDKLEEKVDFEDNAQNTFSENTDDIIEKQFNIEDRSDRPNAKLTVDNIDDKIHTLEQEILEAKIGVVNQKPEVEAAEYFKEQSIQNNEVENVHDETLHNQYKKLNNAGINDITTVNNSIRQNNAKEKHSILIHGSNNIPDPLKEASICENSNPDDFAERLQQKIDEARLIKSREELPFSQQDKPNKPNFYSGTSKFNNNDLLKVKNIIDNKIKDLNYKSIKSTGFNSEFDNNLESNLSPPEQKHRDQINVKKEDFTFYEPIVNSLLQLKSKQLKCNLCCTCLKNEICIFNAYLLFKKVYETYPNLISNTNSNNLHLNRILNDILENINNNKTENCPINKIWFSDPKMKHLLNVKLLRNQENYKKQELNEVNPLLFTIPKHHQPTNQAAQTNNMSNLLLLLLYMKGYIDLPILLILNSNKYLVNNIGLILSMINIDHNHSNHLNFNHNYYNYLLASGIYDNNDRIKNYLLLKLLLNF